MGSVTAGVCNAANAAAVASGVASKAVTQQTKSFKEAKVPHFLQVSTGDGNRLKKLVFGNFGITVGIGAVRTAYGTGQYTDHTGYGTGTYDQIRLVIELHGTVRVIYGRITDIRMVRCDTLDVLLGPISVRRHWMDGAFGILAKISGPVARHKQLICLRGFKGEETNRGIRNVEVEEAKVQEWRFVYLFLVAQSGNGKDQALINRAFKSRPRDRDMRWRVLLKLQTRDTTFIS
ncbi:hypothetical protein DFH08DRAFT_818661 [Mycena albidolilacea]|uniref:Uncharacterized protein n=1 Tax=Mycena albidolilacea TaxID=1033008 RepID=A0AAD7EGB9_9AGAR|nr:hypothetical protein DFH08DRAFT_818661 [Mycena albidolilacea]